MRAARSVLLASALGLTGCAELVGVEDPVAEFEVSPLIEARYLLTMDARDSLGKDELWRFEVSMSIDDRTERTMVMTWTALDHLGDTRVGSEQVFDFTLQNLDTFDFALDDFVLVVDAEATASSLQARLDGDLDGRFPILPPVDVATTAAFCGGVEGVFTQPLEGELTGVTYAAVIIEDDGPLPTASLPTSCATLGEQ